MLVAFEGIDGSGKSTMVRRVAARLRQRGRRVRVTTEPTKTWLGRAVRNGIRHRLDPLALAGLFLADRSLHVASLAPSLARGDLILTDRYADSTTAYQGAALRGRVPAAFEGLRRLQRVLFPRPDLVVFLDLPPRQALRRIRGRAVKEPFEKLRFLSEVRSNYRSLARRDPRRWLKVDATRKPRDVVEDIEAAILERAPDQR